MRVALVLVLGLGLVAGCTASPERTPPLPPPVALASTDSVGIPGDLPSAFAEAHAGRAEVLAQTIDGEVRFYSVASERLLYAIRADTLEAELAEELPRYLGSPDFAEKDATVYSVCAGPAADAERFAAFLRRTGVPAKNIAVEEDLALAPVALVRARPRDCVLVYWRGPALPPHFDRVRAGLDTLRARRIVLVLDAPAPARLSTRSDVVVFAAAAPDEPAIELEGAGRGLMTLLLEEGASGAADLDAGGTVSLGELLTWLQREVTAQAGLDGIDQHPRAWRGAQVLHPSDPAAREAWLPLAPPAR